jgi:hypothetical protein
LDENRLSTAQVLSITSFARLLLVFDPFLMFWIERLPMMLENKELCSIPALLLYQEHLSLPYVVIWTGRRWILEGKGTNLVPLVEGRLF